MGKKLTILKLGGSLITFKDQPSTTNEIALNNVVQEIKAAGLPNDSGKLMLIHGGGSYGHYFAKKFSLSQNPKRMRVDAISTTSSAMLKLHSIVLGHLDHAGVACKTILAPSILNISDLNISSNGIDYLNTIIESHLIPITFGDVMVTKRGAYVVSGDSIAEAVAGALPTERVIFAMDVDGVYSSTSSRSELIKKLISSREFETTVGKFDVTGGLRSKVECALRIAKMGVDVFFANGLKRHRLSKLLQGDREVRSTCIPAIS